MKVLVCPDRMHRTGKMENESQGGSRLTQFIWKIAVKMVYMCLCVALMFLNAMYKINGIHRPIITSKKNITVNSWLLVDS